MAGRGLLSRIARPPAGAAPKKDEVREIADHLRVLLNTRRGDSATVPDFGLDDFADLVHNFPDAIQVLQRSIRQALQKYEPRLRNVSVRELPSEDPLVLRFEITGQLAGSKGRGLLRFRTDCTPGGKFEVEG